MDILFDPKNVKAVKLVKRPGRIWIFFGLILIVGVIFAVIAKNGLVFTPFLVIAGILYAFGGNYYEIGFDDAKREIYRRSHDLLHLTDFHRGVELGQIERIWLIPRFSGRSHTHDDLVLVLRKGKRIKLTSASYEPDREKLLKFSYALAEVAKVDFDNRAEKEE